MILKKFAAGKIARMTCQWNLVREIRHLDLTQNTKLVEKNVQGTLRKRRYLSFSLITQLIHRQFDITRMES